MPNGPNPVTFNTKGLIPVTDGRSGRLAANTGPWEAVCRRYQELPWSIGQDQRQQSRRVARVNQCAMLLPRELHAGQLQCAVEPHGAL